METTKFRIAEAIARAKANGIKIKRQELAQRFWSDSTPEVARLNMTRLCKGETRRIHPEWVGITCEMCQCTPNYLFGYAEN